MISDKVIKEVHKRVNDKLYQRYPLMDTANLEKYDGHWKLWEIVFILEAYEEVKNERD